MRSRSSGYSDSLGLCSVTSLWLQEAQENLRSCYPTHLAGETEASCCDLRSIVLGFWSGHENSSNRSRKRGSYGTSRPNTQAVVVFTDNCSSVSWRLLQQRQTQLFHVGKGRLDQTKSLRFWNARWEGGSQATIGAEFTTAKSHSGKFSLIARGPWAARDAHR